MTNPSVASIVALAASRPPQLGDTRLITIDGPAGSGKSTLAGRIGDRLECQVLHADDMYEGWTGLTTLNDTLVNEVLVPLAQHRRAGFARWDWESDARAERIEVPAGEWLVIEGVGCANAVAREFACVVAWVDAPWEERLRRGLERDGESMRGHWERWQVSEAAYFSREGVRADADVVIDGTVPVPES